MGTRAPRYTIILAAGEGTRMGSTTHHKVCYPIKGQPAVNRAIEIYNKCGIEQHILVVGALAGQVIETVGSAFENVIFAYQAQRLGTAHAAIKFGRKGKLGKVTFYDFSVPDIVPFPNDYALVVCDSGVTAKKTGSARDLFNHRICCYGIGFLQIKKYFPQYAAVLHHLRDVNLNALNIPLSEIYRILLRLPEGVTRDELRALLPDEDLDIFFNQHHPPDDGLYPIRGVILFGLAEMERSKRFADEMKTGRIEELGRLMNISHDGDRIVSITAVAARGRIGRRPQTSIS